MHRPHIRQQFGVFLSSTNDPEVRKYRLAAKNILMEEEFRHRWYPVEMDEFPPSPSSSLEECRDRVLECFVYVGILGPFYGTVNDEKNLSYTEYEYTVAQEVRREIAIFLLPDHILSSSPPELIIRQGSLLRRQLEFKERVNATHTTRSAIDLNDFEAHFRRYLRNLDVVEPPQEVVIPAQTIFPGEESYDRQPVAIYNLNDLNEKSIINFLRTPQAQMALDRHELMDVTRSEHLRILGLMHRNGKPTLGAFFCFGPFDSLVDKYSSCSLHMVVYEGSDKVTARTIYKEEAEDNLINLHYIGMRFFRSQSGLKRIGNVGTDDRDELEIPTIALREALANALVHRDYEHQHSREQPTRIEVYFNRIEIISFGNLVAGVSEQVLNQHPDQIQSRRRNPIIAKIFMYMQIVELGGSGIGRMHQSMRDRDLPPPEILQFEGDIPSVRVIFRRPVVEVGTSLPKFLRPIPRVQGAEEGSQSAVSNQRDYLFLSYRSTDVDFALKLALDLKEANIKIWMDRFDIAPGDDWRRSLESAVYQSNMMIALLSPSYVSSKYCQREIARMDRMGRRIIAILIAPISDADWPLEIEREQYFDFTNRDNEQDYKNQLKHLIAYFQEFRTDDGQ